MTISGNIIGVQELIGKLHLSQKITDAQDKGYRQVAQLLRAKMVEYVQAGHPEHPQVITGRLKASIRIKPVGIVSSKTMGYIIGSDASYAAAVEYGHKTRKGKGKISSRIKSSFMTKPYPWFRPAITDVISSGDAKTLINNAIGEGIAAMLR